MTLDDDARAELEALEAIHRRRVSKVIDGRQGADVELDGRLVANFASNDYLGLAGDSQLIEAAKAALDRDGVGAGASRLVVGNHQEHVDLEQALAGWLEMPAVRVFSSGYAANVGTLTTLLRAGDVVFSDELNHASIIDGCRLSRAQIVVYPHRDLVDLEQKLKSHGGRRRLIVSETLFSMDGDLADVERLSHLAARYDAAWMLDEAHAIGVLGPSGRGVAARAGCVPDVLVGTLGKAFGAAGAFVATTQAVSDLLWNRARSFVFSTGLPPAIAGAANQALEIIQGSRGDTLRRQLADRVRELRQSIRAQGADESPIAPIVIGNDERVVELSRQWLAEGSFVQAIRPPTVPIGTARLRVSLSAAHQPEHVAQLCASIRRST